MSIEDRQAARGGNVVRRVSATLLEVPVGFYSDDGQDRGDGVAIIGPGDPDYADYAAVLAREEVEAADHATRQDLAGKIRTATSLAMSKSSTMADELVELLGDPEGWPVAVHAELVKLFSTHTLLRKDVYVPCHGDHGYFVACGGASAPRGGNPTRNAAGRIQASSSHANQDSLRRAFRGGQMPPNEYLHNLGLLYHNGVITERTFQTYSAAVGSPQSLPDAYRQGAAPYDSSLARPGGSSRTPAQTTSTTTSTTNPNQGAIDNAHQAYVNGGHYQAGIDHAQETLDRLYGAGRYNAVDLLQQDPSGRNVGLGRPVNIALAQSRSGSGRVNTPLSTTTQTSAQTQTPAQAQVNAIETGFDTERPNNQFTGMTPEKLAYVTSRTQQFLDGGGQVYHIDGSALSSSDRAALYQTLEGERRAQQAADTGYQPNPGATNGYDAMRNALRSLYSGGGVVIARDAQGNLAAAVGYNPETGVSDPNLHISWTGSVRPNAGTAVVAKLAAVADRQSYSIHSAPIQNQGSRIGRSTMDWHANIGRRGPGSRWNRSDVRQIATAMRNVSTYHAGTHPATTRTP